MTGMQETASFSEAKTLTVCQELKITQRRLYLKAPTKKRLCPWLNKLQLPEKPCFPGVWGELWQQVNKHEAQTFEHILEAAARGWSCASPWPSSGQGLAGLGQEGSRSSLQVPRGC